MGPRSVDAVIGRLTRAGERERFEIREGLIREGASGGEGGREEVFLRRRWRQGRS